MSFLGKKRIQRDEEDEKVRHNHIILLKKLNKKEYNQMFGIKEEEPQKEENIGIQEENNNYLEEYKKENKEIKIIETTIILPIKEKIKSKSNKKEKKEIIKEEKSTIQVFSSPKNYSIKKLEIKKDIGEKKIENEEKKEKNDLNNAKTLDNPFKNLFEKDSIKQIKESSKDEKSNPTLFGNIDNKDKINNKDKIENKPAISLFGNLNDKKDNKEIIQNRPVISLFGSIKDNKETIENKPAISLFGNINDIKDNKPENKSLFSNTNSLFSANNKGIFSSDNNFSLFSNNINNNQPLFFGNNNSNSLSFGNSNNNNSIFSNNSGNIDDKNNTPLFQNNNNISNPFSQIKGESFLKSILNNNNNENNKNDNNGSLFGIKSNNNINEGDGEDEEDERDKPKTIYIGEPLKSQDYSNYSKLYNTHLDNLFLYNKNKKKYISKGNGNFSIEKTKDENSKEHQAVIVFRNQTGNKLVEGFINKKFDKLDISNKDFNFVLSFGIIMMIEGKPELGFIKIPFKNEENANKLKDAFDKAILFLEGK